MSNFSHNETYKIGPFITIYKNTSKVNDYISRCTQFAPFKSIELGGGEKRNLYLENFPNAIPVPFGDLKKISGVKLRSQGKDSLVTLRTYECVVISAILNATDGKIVAMYHYFRQRDTKYVGVADFIHLLLKKIQAMQIMPSDVHIELASSFLSDPMVEIASRISRAGLSIQFIHSKRLVVLKPGLEYVSDTNNTIIASDITSSIGVLINENTGIEVFLDQ